MTGTSMEARRGRSPAGGVAWRTYVDLLERAQRAAGGADAFRRIVRSRFASVAPDVTAWAALCADTPAFLELVLDVLFPLLYPGLGFARVQRRETSFTWHCEVPVHLAAAPAVFELLAGAIEACGELKDGKVRIATMHGGRTMRASVSWSSSTAGELARASVANVAALGHPSPLLDVLADARDLLATHARSMVRATRAHASVDAAADAWCLTARETSVLQALALGSSNKEIAAAVGCSHRTVEVHLRAIFKKAGVAGRGEVLARLWTMR